MRYSPKGMCLNDFDVFKLDGLYHLIHLQGPPIFPFAAEYLETSYGHAVSDDLINWKPQAPAFGIAEYPNFDDSSIWTMKVIEQKNTLFMFYTGVCRDYYFRQQIGLAISEKESINWKRYKKNPILSADPRYYQTEEDMAWRDPYVIYDEKKKQWVMYLCAKEKNGEKDKRGCIGLAISKNLFDWEIKKPVIAPRLYKEMECPVLYKSKGQYYMFVSISDDRMIHSYQSSSLYGPFDHSGTIASPYNYAPRIIKDNNGDLVLLHTIAKRWNNNDKGEIMRGYLAQPKRLILHTISKPLLGWYDPIEKYYKKTNTKKFYNFILEIDLTQDYKDINIGMRITHEHTIKNGINVVINKQSLLIKYFEDNHILNKVLLDEKGFNSIKILIHQEYIEVYCDTILHISTFAYRHRSSKGTNEVFINGKPCDYRVKENFRTAANFQKKGR
jgi:sucrose-6-phosphate hydrolase SacC (GH32 family)